MKEQLFNVIECIHVEKEILLSFLLFVCFVFSQLAREIDEFDKTHSATNDENQPPKKRIRGKMNGILLRG